MPQYLETPGLLVQSLCSQVHRLKLPPKTRPHAKLKWCTILTKHVEENNEQTTYLYG